MSFALCCFFVFFSLTLFKTSVLCSTELFQDLSQLQETWLAEGECFKISGRERKKKKKREQKRKGGEMGKNGKVVRGEKSSLELLA